MNRSSLMIVTISVLLIVSTLSTGSPLESSSSSASSSSSVDLTNVFNRCFNNPHEVKVKSQIKLSPLLSCNRDFFNVDLHGTTIKGLNEYQVAPFKRVNKDKYEAIMKLPRISIKSKYQIAGPVAHMFPVFGDGTLEIDYDNVSVNLGVKKVSQSPGNHSVTLFIDKIDFENGGYEVINGKHSVDNKGDHLDKGFQESFGRVIFWQVFKELREEQQFSSTLNCLEESIQSDKLLDNLEYYKDISTNKGHGKVIEIVPIEEPKSHHSSIHSAEGYSRAKREVEISLPNIPQDEFKQSHWYHLADSDIQSAVKHQKIDKIAKNVILFIGDGMGVSTLTAARILKEQLNGGPGNGNKLFFENFPESALIKTFNLDRQTPDSAGTATAFTCGIKANYGTLGVSGMIFRSEKNCEVIKENAVPSIFTWAQSAGKATGIVTTTRITHATPAAGYSHVANRDWESDTDVTKNGAKCRDIASQLVEDAPGNRLNVIMGGGWKSFAGANVSDPTASAGAPGVRTDGVNLVDRWIADRKNLRSNWAFVTNSSDLKSIDTSNTDYLLGLFNRDHLPYELERNKKPEGSPSLAELVESAIKVLSRNDEGFVLLVEGGLIDIAHHENLARLSLHEVLGLDAAIEKTTELVSPDETLLIVTADHSHGFTINGYPLRGNDIFGVSDSKEETSGKTFATLQYITGPGHVEERPDELSVKDRENPRHKFYSSINMSAAVHGGEDVALYSVGPMSHLFNGLHDQSYIAHVIAYSSCIGDYASSKRCKKVTTGNAASGTKVKQ